MSRAPRRLRHVLLLGAALTLPLAAPPGTAAQAEPPGPLAERPIQFPDFDELTLDNGLRVLVLSYGTQPVMSARLYVRGGGAAEPGELAGLAGMTAGVLTKGTTTRDADEISETIEGVGGSLSASAGQDFLTVSTTVLTDHMDLAFELLEDVVRNATFPEDEVELFRRQTLSGLQAQLGQPQAIASRRFSEVVYGEAHPYGVSATPETVRAITRDDLVAFRDRVLRADGALLVVAGRVELDEVEARVRRHFEDWNGLPRPAVDLPEPPERVRSRIYLVHRPGSVQSVIHVGHLALTPGHPDYFPAEVLNRVLGGGADSRLFRILREERGWTYGAYSSFSRPVQVGTFSAGAEVRTAVTDSALVELLHQVDRLQTEPVSEEELDAARNYLAGSFPLRLQTADQVAGQLASTLLLDLPVDELTGYPLRIREVTAADVQRAAREHLHPDRMAIVVVGDGTRILESLEAIGDVVLLDIEGEPLERDEVVGDAEAAVRAWDASRLVEGIRRYEIYVQDNPMGSAEYRLERDGDDWLSTTRITTPLGFQETLLRFDARDFTPRSVLQDQGQGGMGVNADLRMEGGRIVGTVELPPQLGGPREMDDSFPPGTLLPGMDEYAFQVADLEMGARITVPYVDLAQGEPVTLQARVIGEEEITVMAGTFETWVVEVSGGAQPTTLFLRKEAPHILIRQEMTGQPVRLDLAGTAPL